MAKKKSIYDEMSLEAIDALIANAEITPAGSLIFEECFIDPTAEGYEFIIDYDAQPREVTDGSGLVNDICMRGQIDPLILAIYSGGLIPEVGAGHRRRHAAYLIKTERPDDYDRVYPNGVPCKIATGKVVNGKVVNLTHMDMHLMRADHDTDSLKQSLSSKIECVKMTRPLFRQGMKTPEVIFHTWRTVSRIMSNKYNALCEEVDALASKAEQLKVLDRSQHGNFQFLKALADSPDALFDMWSKGEKGEGAKLSQKVVKELASKFRNAQSEADRTPGAEPVTLECPPEDWTEALTDAVTEANTPADEKPDTPKMLKKSKVEEILKKTKSASGRLVLQMVLGLPGAERLYYNNYDVPVSGFCNLREKKPRLVEAMLEFGGLDEDITKEQFKAMKAVFQPKTEEPSMHVETAKEVAAETAKAGKKGKAKPKAKAKPRK